MPANDSGKKWSKPSSLPLAFWVNAWSTIANAFNDVQVSDEHAPMYIFIWLYSCHISQGTFSASTVNANILLRES